MNIVPLCANDAQTMSSREIADLTGKEHRNVMRDARQMLTELYGEGGVLRFEHTHTNPQNGQSYPVFLLPKRETLILVSGYNVQMRAKIIDRWQELESQQLARPFPTLPIRRRQPSHGPPNTGQRKKPRPKWRNWKRKWRS